MIKLVLIVINLICFLSCSSIFAFATDIKDVKYPLYLPHSMYIVIPIVVVIAIIIIALITMFLIKRLKRKKDLAIIQRTPWEIAYESLQILRSEDLPSKDMIKEYFTRLSDIVRSYIEGRFDINAPEMTSEEFLRDKETSSKLNNLQYEHLKDFLNCSDMVKFAKYGSNIEEMNKSFYLAKRLIDETKQS